MSEYLTNTTQWTRPVRKSFRSLYLKIYKSLASRLIGFSKVTCLTILTHLITEYAELDDDTVQETDKNMKTPINCDTLHEEFVEQIERNQEVAAVQNLYSLKKMPQLTTLRNCVSILKITVSGT